MSDEHTPPRAQDDDIEDEQASNDELARATLRAMEDLLASLSVWPAWVDYLRKWVPATDLHARRVEVLYAVDQWIQRGLVGVLVAAGGTGKTTLLLALGICHALGILFFGRKVQRGTFVLLSSDDSQADLDGALSLVVRAMRLTAAQAATVAAKCRVVSLQQSDGCKTFTTFAAGRVELTGLEATILHAVEGIPDLVGIALDTLRQFSGGNSNDEVVIKLTIGAATYLAQRTGAYVILPHHTGKQNYRDGVTDMYAGSGSAAIADNARFVLLLQTATWKDIEGQVKRTGQERGTPLVLTSTRGSLLVKPPAPLYLYRDGFHIGHIAGAVLTREQQLDERDREVLRAIRDGCQSKRAILHRVGGKAADQSARIDNLEARGLIASQSASRSKLAFIVTAEGASWLDYRA